MYTFSLVIFFFFSLVSAADVVVQPTSSPVATAVGSGVGKSVTPPVAVASQMVDSSGVLKTNYVTYIKFSFCDNGAIDK